VTRRLRIGLVFGGASVEHEVSVVSARGVAAALDRRRFEMVPIGIAADGRWLPPERSATILGSSATRADAGVPDDGGRLLIDPGAGGLVRIAAGKPRVPLPLDVVFPVAHGWGGEDGRLQGLLDLCGLPYVGAGVSGSSVGMDKEFAKVLFEHRGLPVGPWRSVSREAFHADPPGTAAQLSEVLGFPMFTKPANGGSSVGISKVAEAGALPAALAVAFEHDRKVVVEAGFDAREIECAVLGNDAPEASPCGEIEPSGEFYDYAAKYQNGTSKLTIPAAIPEEVSERVRVLAVEAFRALGLAGMARVDFFLDRHSDRVLLNEVNTLPGFTPISMYPKLWGAAGLAYPELLARLIDLARERFDEECRRATRRETTRGSSESP
jgi:D-alanine-D-alanine ligase